MRFFKCSAGITRSSRRLRRSNPCIRCNLWGAIWWNQGFIKIVTNKLQDQSFHPAIYA